MYLLQANLEVFICATQDFTGELFRNSFNFLLQHPASFCEMELFVVGPQEILAMLGIEVRRSWGPALPTAYAIWKSAVQDRAAKYIMRNVQDDVLCT
jgi:hypothetical protein